MLVDAGKESLQADKILLPLAAIRAGKGYLTEQGSAENAFDFEKYDLKQVINTSGRMTILGVSTPRPGKLIAGCSGEHEPVLQK